MASLNSVTMRSAQRLRRVNSHGGLGCGLGCNCTGRDEGLATAFIGGTDGVTDGRASVYKCCLKHEVRQRGSRRGVNLWSQERPFPEKKPSAFLQKEKGDFRGTQMWTKYNNIPHRFVSLTLS